MLSVSNALRDSIQYALDHREEALAYAMQFARDLDPQLADKFVGMYVNERTLDYGSDGPGSCSKRNRSAQAISGRNSSWS